MEYAADTYGVTHTGILDFDLQHGDGTQNICLKRAGLKVHTDPDSSDEYNGSGNRFVEFPKVGYFSIHDINYFPTEIAYALKNVL